MAFSLVEGRDRNSNLILSFQGSLELHLASKKFLLLFSLSVPMLQDLISPPEHFLVSEAYQISVSNIICI